MSWKQPIPTDVKDCEELTVLEVMLFCYIMLYTRNTDGTYSFTHHGKHYDGELKRGQCIFKTSAVADNLGIDWKRIRRGIDRLSKAYSPMEIVRKPFGLIITTLKFDEFSNMENVVENAGNYKGECRENVARANKNDKNVENVKNVKEDALTDIEINEIAKNEDVAVQYVLRTLDLIKQYEQTHSKKYRNYKLTLKNWIKRDKQTNLNIPIYVPEPTPEERAKWAHIQEEYDRTHTN